MSGTVKDTWKRFGRTRNDQRSNRLKFAKECKDQNVRSAKRRDHERAIAEGMGYEYKGRRTEYGSDTWRVPEFIIKELLQEE